MNYIDIILLLICVLFFVLGWKARGIYLIVIPLAFFFGIIAANYGSAWLDPKLAKLIKNDVTRSLFAYALVFLVASGLVVLGLLSLARFFDYHDMSVFDRLLGSLALILLMLIPTYYLLLFLGEKLTYKPLHLKETLGKSYFFPYLQKYVLFAVNLGVLKDFLKYNLIIK